MITYVAFFRGINVGGKNALPMKELVAVFENKDARNIQTYIQSGNVIFQSVEENIATISSSISMDIEKRFDFSPRIVVLKFDQIANIIANNPFHEAEALPETLHVGLLSGAPVKPDLSKLESIKKASERFHLEGRVFYLHAPEGFGRSKLAANSEKLLGVPMTFRNWRTLCKIEEMAK